jgi:hypothetical protein
LGTQADSVVKILVRATGGYKEFVKEKWLTLRIVGWGGYVLNEKLKMIKGGLKYWHQSHT